MDSNECGCKATVLIVDDSAFNLIPLEYMLKKMGIICDKANGGLEAINMFIKNRKKTCCIKKYKVVLMDLNMPNLDGFKAT